MRRIVAGPAASAEALIGAYKPERLVTLRAPNDNAAPLVFAGDRHLMLQFNDISEPRPGLVAPDSAMMERLLDFGRAWKEAGPLLISCFAGVSRSTAAAYGIACLHTAPGSEESLAYALRERAPTATPNILMVGLIDALLGRGGRMSEAIARIGRGQDTDYGTPFTLDIP